MLPLLVDGRLPTIIQPQRASEVPLRSSTVTLRCRATGDGSLKYYWERHDLGNWITVDNNNRTSYTTGTTGQYRCNVTNEVGSVVSPVITVYGKLCKLIIHIIHLLIDSILVLIKTHGSESRGQEEAACMRVFWPTRPLQ